MGCHKNVSRSRPQQVIYVAAVELQHYRFDTLEFIQTYSR
jgi:hypothetical protein